MWRVGAAAAVGLLLVLGGLAIDLSQHGDRLAGSNSFVEFSGFALPVEPHAQRCAFHQHVPAAAAAVRVYAGTFGRRGGPFAVSVSSGGRLVSAGRAAGGYADNATPRVPLGLVRRNLYDATVCLRNLGPARLQFAGNLTPQAGVRLAGTDVIRFDWLLGGRPTWWDVAPKVAARFAVIKPGFVESWTFWAIFGVIALLWASAIAVLMRRPTR